MSDSIDPRPMEFVGLSSTGTKHGLLVAPKPSEAAIVFTVTGANGKRHASVRLEAGQILDLARFLAGDHE